MNGCTTKEIEGKIFQYGVKDMAFMFVSCKNINETGYTVTHIASGKHMCSVESEVFPIGTIGAARESIGNLIKRVGAESIYNELTETE